MADRDGVIWLEVSNETTFILLICYKDITMWFVLFSSLFRTVVILKQNSLAVVSLFGQATKFKGRALSRATKALRFILQGVWTVLFIQDRQWFSSKFTTLLNWTQYAVISKPSLLAFTIRHFCSSKLLLVSKGLLDRPPKPTSQLPPIVYGFLPITYN